MKKRVLSIILSLALLAALLLPVNTSRAAVSVETGIYSAMVESGMWLIDLKDIGRNKVEISIAWSSDSSAYGTPKPFRKKIKKTIKFNVTGNYINPDKTVSDETITIKGSIKLGRKKLKCNINGESFTARIVQENI